VDARLIDRISADPSGSRRIRKRGADGSLSERGGKFSPSRKIALPTKKAKSIGMPKFPITPSQLNESEAELLMVHQALFWSAWGCGGLDQDRTGKKLFEVVCGEREQSMPPNCSLRMDTSRKLGR
jgi:hypothetical protein